MTSILLMATSIFEIAPKFFCVFFLTAKLIFVLTQTLKKKNFMRILFFVCIT